MTDPSCRDGTPRAWGNPARPRAQARCEPEIESFEIEDWYDRDNWRAIDNWRERAVRRAARSACGAFEPDRSCIDATRARWESHFGTSRIEERFFEIQLQVGRDRSF